MPEQPQKPKKPIENFQMLKERLYDKIKISKRALDVVIVLLFIILAIVVFVAVRDVA